MKDTANSNNIVSSVTEPQSLFKGYTLEELRYQRALVMLQKEFCRSKIHRNLNALQKSNPLSPSASKASSLPGKVGFVAQKLFTGLNYLDYIMLGFSAFGSARKIYSFFHKKKK
jgi:hypothetical protein